MEHKQGDCPKCRVERLFRVEDEGEFFDQHENKYNRITYTCVVCNFKAVAKKINMYKAFSKADPND